MKQGKKRQRIIQDWSDSGAKRGRDLPNICRSHQTWTVRSVQERKISAGINVGQCQTLLMHSSLAWQLSRSWRGQPKVKNPAGKGFGKPDFHCKTQPQPQAGRTTKRLWKICCQPGIKENFCCGFQNSQNSEHQFSLPCCLEEAQGVCCPPYLVHTSPTKVFQNTFHFLSEDFQILETSKHFFSPLHWSKYHISCKKILITCKKNSEIRLELGHCPVQPTQQISYFISDTSLEFHANLGEPCLHPNLTRHAWKFVLLSQRLFLSLIQPHALRSRDPSFPLWLRAAVPCEWRGAAGILQILPQLKLSAHLFHILTIPWLFSKILVSVHVLSARGAGGACPRGWAELWAPSSPQIWATLSNTSLLFYLDYF